MIFLVQNTQNRDTYAIQLKLDEIVHALRNAHNALLDIEELSDEDLLLIKKRYSEMAKNSREELRRILAEEKSKTKKERPRRKAA